MEKYYNGRAQIPSKIVLHNIWTSPKVQLNIYTTISLKICIEDWNFLTKISFYPSNKLLKVQVIQEKKNHTPQQFLLFFPLECFMIYLFNAKFIFLSVRRKFKKISFKYYCSLLVFFCGFFFLPLHDYISKVFFARKMFWTSKVENY